jgi:hypothetical protein
MAQLHVGKHRHEPFIARVLQEAAARAREISLSYYWCSGFFFNQRFRYDKRFRFLSIYEQEISNAVSFMRRVR